MKYEFYTAPGRAQTLISHVRLSTLKGKENLRIVPQEKELPPIDRSTTVKETEGMGKMLTYYFPILGKS